MGMKEKFLLVFIFILFFVLYYAFERLLPPINQELKIRNIQKFLKDRNKDFQFTIVNIEITGIFDDYTIQACDDLVVYQCKYHGLSESLLFIEYFKSAVHRKNKSEKDLDLISDTIAYMCSIYAG